MFYNKAESSFFKVDRREENIFFPQNFFLTSTVQNHIYMLPQCSVFFSNLVTLQPALLVAVGRTLQLEDLDEKGSMGSVTTVCNSYQNGLNSGLVRDTSLKKHSHHSMHSDTQHFTTGTSSPMSPTQSIFENSHFRPLSPGYDKYVRYEILM